MSNIFYQSNIQKEMSFKEGLRIYIVGLALMLILYLSCNFIFNHYLIKNSCIVEAVITRKYSGIRNRQYSDYVYTINGANFSNTTNSSKNASVNDTILVVVSASKQERSRPISLFRGRAIILYDIKQRVVVNNMSADEKRELSDKLMADLRRRYWVKSKKGK